MPAPPRPSRLTLRDEAGRTRSLLDGPEAFDVSGAGHEILFLGLGPDPAAAAALVPAGEAAGYVECPAFAAAMPPAWRAAIPARFRAVAPEDLTPERAGRSRLLLYRQNPRLFPSFWGPVLSRLRLAALPDRKSDQPETGPVLLVRPGAGLLEPELARALGALGLPVQDIPAANALAALTHVLAATKPQFFLCVNGAGLDPDGLVAALLAEAGVPAALWAVDNPFHILSRFRAPFWKTLHLAVTDDWFLAPLRELGAASVHHLPLAASAHFFKAVPTPGLAGRAVFVGRSAFPGRDGFFAGLRPPEALMATAQAMLAGGGRPDFGWWTAALGTGPLWPGKAARLAGCGAETAGLAWRGLCLTALARAMPLTIYGDAGWQDRIPGAVLHGPVDYYGELAGLYAGAAVSVNLTSPLLPRGLTQRHFDVWAAGGTLVTDATPGLALFPAELTRPIAFGHPDEAGALARALAGDPVRRGELAAAWKAHLAAHHTYEHRLTRLLAMIRTAARP